MHKSVNRLQENVRQEPHPEQCEIVFPNSIGLLSLIVVLDEVLEFHDEGIEFHDEGIDYRGEGIECLVRALLPSPEDLP